MAAYLDHPLVAALLATLLISLAPFVILFLIYLCRRNRVGSGPLLSASVLKIFVAFAIGGLLGDAFLHLLPHAMSPHAHAPEPIGLLAELARVTMPTHKVHAAFGGSSATAHGSLKEQGHQYGGHEHAHDHSHGESGHAHSHDAPPKKPAAVTPKEAGRATGHSHAHSHSHAAAAPPAKAPTKEAGLASGHSHSHSAHSHSAHSHAGDDHSGHDHSAGMNVGLFTLAGMFAFFLIEKTARAHSGGGADAGHGHSHGGHAHAATEKQSDSEEEEEEGEDEGASSVSLRPKRGQSADADAAFAQAAKTKKRAKLIVHLSPPRVTADQRITGLLNLIGDFSHNFTDGMAIAASYLAGGSIGLSTTIAVLIHEVPHEIGDFAILLQSGFTVPAALKAQLLTAIGAIAGCCFGYWSGATGEAAQSSWIIPFTAGGFIYVACVNVLPTLLPHQSFRQTVCEILAMWLGVALMVMIAAFE